MKSDKPALHTLRLSDAEVYLLLQSLESATIRGKDAILVAKGIEKLQKVAKKIAPMMDDGL